MNTPALEGSVPPKGITMSMYASALWCLLVPALGQFELDPPDPAARLALRKLQGSWKIDSLDESGTKISEDDVKQRTILFGAEVFLLRQGAKVMEAGSVQVAPAKDPKTINVMVRVGKNKGKVMLGIYKLEKDTLTLCLDVEGEERPKEFAGGKNRMLAVCSRVRGKNEEKDIAGPYKSESIQENGSKYLSDANIDRVGDAYLVTYKKGPITAYVAVGVRQGDIFALAWANQGQVGITLYKIEDDGRLVGQYTQLGSPGILSQEILTPAKKPADI